VFSAFLDKEWRDHNVLNHTKEANKAAFIFVNTRGEAVVIPAAGCAGFEKHRAEVIFK